MSRVSAARQWLRAHPIRADAVFALLLAGFLLLPYLGGSSPDGEPLDLTPFLFVVLVVTCACLVVRRVAPWSTWVTTTVLGLLAVAVSHGPSPIYFPSVLALYTVAVRFGLTRTTVIATVLSAGVPVVVILGASDHGLVEAIGFGMTAWSGMALMSGLAVRAQRSAMSAAIERARLAEATRDTEARRQVVQERLRIARDLHDVFAHHVSAINAQAGVASVLADDDPAGASAALSHVRQSSQAILREIPGLLGVLRADDDELQTAPPPGLVDLTDLIDNARAGGATITWQTTGTPIPLAPSTELAAYRIVQESLTNARRHGTGGVFGSLEFADGAARLTISNAIAETRSVDTAAHHGVIGMRERVTAAGGTITVGEQTRGVWTVECDLPAATAGARPELPTS